MSIRDREYLVTCDECSEDIETHEDDMNRALKMASDAGWRVFCTPKNELANACPACVETYRHKR